MPSSRHESGRDERSQEMSRRDFLRAVAIGGIGLAVPGLVIYKDVIDGGRGDTKAELAAKQRRADKAYLNETARDGMSKGWLTANVWPGLAIMPSTVKLFGTATLDKGSELDWPTAAKQDHLAVQRPFLVGASIELNYEDIPDSSTNIGSQVLGFWMPSSEQMAFCDRSKYRDEIVMPTNSSAAIYSYDYQQIAGEQVQLQSALKLGGLTYRFLEVEDKQLFEDPRRTDDIVTKVVGRSIWADLTEATQAYHDFAYRSGNDLVQLPVTP